MLKKIVCIVLCLFSLVACMSKETRDLETIVNKGINDAIPYNDNVGVNNITKYFSYYLPKDMTEDICEETYAVFEFLDNPMVLNLNISNMINKKYFTDVKLSSDDYFNSDKLIYSTQGKYTTKKDSQEEFYIYIYEKDDTSVYIEFVSPVISFHALSSYEMLEEVIRHIVFIAQYISVDEELVLKNYYDRDLIDYQKKNVDLFDKIVPANGRLEEMVVGE